MPQMKRDWFDGWLNAQQFLLALQNRRKGSAVCRLFRRRWRTGSWSLRSRALAFFTAFAVLFLEVFDRCALDGLLHFILPDFILLFAVFFLLTLLLGFVQCLFHERDAFGKRVLQRKTLGGPGEGQRRPLRLRIPGFSLCGFFTSACFQAGDRVSSTALSIFS